uniref:Reverse transcriptase domain-containing protein n=1 Tax=Trichuris muris TaxID=70415 RepID=A0A5S6R0B7_TRIMR
MEYLEDVAFFIIDNSLGPKVFKRYVDDIFAITEIGKEDVFLRHLNVHGSIVVSIPACHASDPGSIPGRGDGKRPLSMNCQIWNQ